MILSLQEYFSAKICTPPAICYIVLLYYDDCRKELLPESSGILLIQIKRNCIMLTIGVLKEPGFETRVS